MSPSTSESAELFRMLESNRPQDVEDIKCRFAEIFNTLKDSWLINGLIDYYQSTGSKRCIEILIKVPVPHDKYLFDKLGEGLRSSWRCGALALLGHVVRRQPLWQHKITQHSIFRDLLGVLRTEKDVVPLMSALLVLITLLPMIPTLISPFFHEIFDVFARLASWENHRGADTLEGHKVHLQLGLYSLFHTLYGMYPCNFVDFLKREYSKRENIEIFTHTIKPMLETVRMHPSLITASKIAETDNARWKKMEHHDVLVECRRFSSESTHKHKTGDAEDNSFRSRCGTDVSSLLGSTSSYFQSSKSSNSTPNLTESQTLTKTTVTTIPSDPSSVAIISRKCANLEPGSDTWFSLSDACGAPSTLSAPQTPLPLPTNTFQDTPVSHTPVAQIPISVKQQDSGSPPEAAIEATPENTPIKDTRQRFTYPSNSPVVRALGARLSQQQQQQVSLQQYQPHLVSSYSQPPSPLKKEPSPLSRMSSVDASGSSEGQEQRKDSFYCHNRLNKVIHERSQQSSESFSSIIPSPQQKLNSGSPLKKVSLKDCSGSLVPSVPNSPVPLGTAAPVSGSTDWPLAKPKPHKDGVPFDALTNKEAINNLYLISNTVENNKEDKEIMELSKRGEVIRSTTITRDANIIISEGDMKPHTLSRHQQDADCHEDCEDHWAEEEMTCKGEDLLCVGRKHGLHMPCSNSMLDFARRVTRIRFHSQCVQEPSNYNSAKFSIENNSENGKTNIIIRKSTSCPELKSLNSLDNVAVKNGNMKEKVQQDKELFLQSSVAFENGNITVLDPSKDLKTEETQTVEIMDILKNLSEQSLKGGDNATDEKTLPDQQVDRYIEIISQSRSYRDMTDCRSPKEETDHLREQLQLLHLELLYERHRREVHAFRNRRLLGRSRKNRAAEEQNQALKQQISSLQIEVDDLRQQVGKQKQSLYTMDQKHQETSKYWQHQLYLRDSEILAERQEKEQLATLLLDQRSISNDASADVQHLRAELFDVTQQLDRANRKSEVGDRLMEYIKRMQREIVMCGERDARYREALSMPLKTDVLLNKLTQQYKEQLVNAQATLQSQTSKMDYLQAREAELEAIVSGKDMAAQELKKQLRLVKEEYSERLKAVEDKYQSVKRINQRMEAHCLELLQRVPQSPQTISRDLTSGFSPQSSPLSASLASSEGHVSLLASRVDEIRNLQVMVNAHETIEESTSNSVNNTAFEDDGH